MFDIFRWQNGRLCIICDAKPERHPTILKEYTARIVVEGVAERQLNGLGQLILVRHKITELNSKTIISVDDADNIDDLLEYKGKKLIKFYVEIPDEIYNSMK